MHSGERKYRGGSGNSALGMRGRVTLANYFSWCAPVGACLNHIMKFGGSEWWRPTGAPDAEVLTLIDEYFPNNISVCSLIDCRVFYK